MQTLLQDIRYAIRQLRNAPGFTLVAVLTIALGIGANTAIYSIIHGALRLPYPHPDRMVAIQNVYPEGKYFASSYPDFEQWRAASKSSQVIALDPRRAKWSGPAGPEIINVNFVSEDYFQIYGLKPFLGRAFETSDHKKSGAPVAVLTESFWRQKFGADPSIVGKSINLNDTTFTIVGVAPNLVNSVWPSVAWVPLEPRPRSNHRGMNYLFTTALLHSGFTQNQALVELQGIQAQINKQFPQYKHDLDIQPLSKVSFGDLHILMLLLQAAVAFILLIACANLANMLLARAANRARELSIRRALGASPLRLVLQTLTEGLLLSLSGAGVGLLFAQALTHLPIAAWPKGFLRPTDVHLDGTVLGFTLLLALGTGIIFGLVPALRILKQDENGALQQGRTMTESRGQTRVRAALVVAEIAVSMLLVVGALNMAFYFLRLLRVDPGINPENTLAMTVSLSPTHYATPVEQSRFFQTLLNNLQTLPGVMNAAASADTPFTPFDSEGSNGDFSYDGQPQGTADHNPFADFHYVTSNYFATAQTPLLQGRDFTRQDRPGSQKVAIINRDMARKLWPGQNPIGKHIQCCSQDGLFTVIGVAGDVHFSGPASPAHFAIYMSADQEPQPAMGLVLRTRGDPMALADSARRLVASIDPGQAVSNITSLQTLEQESIAGQRTSTMVTALLGCLALLLASIGVYGVMSYSVSSRQREFAVRMALGADRLNILKVLFLGMLRLALTGMIIGAGLSLAMRAWIESLLGANESTPYALVASALMLCGVAALATLLPARHAMYVEPMQALRTE